MSFNPREFFGDDFEPGETARENNDDLADDPPDNDRESESSGSSDGDSGRSSDDSGGNRNEGLFDIINPFDEGAQLTDDIVDVDRDSADVDVRGYDVCQPERLSEPLPFGFRDPRDRREDRR